MNNFYGNAAHSDVSGPGHWQDPDMLVVGMPGLNLQEYRTHFALWAISAAPLWAGIDLRVMSSDVRNIFLNRDIIAVDQDPLGIAGHKLASTAPSLPHTKMEVPPPDGTKIAVQPCDVSSAWYYNTTDFSLRTDNTCATIQDCSTNAGGSAIVWQCVGQNGGCPRNQMYDMVESGPGVMFVSKISGFCLDAGPGTQGYSITQQVCDKNNNMQLWKPQGNKFQVLGGNNMCLGVGGTKPSEIWVKKLSAPSNQTAYAVVLFNPDDHVPASITLRFQDLGLQPESKYPIVLRDLWQHQPVQPTKPGFFSSVVGPHGNFMLKIVQSIK